MDNRKYYIIENVFNQSLVAIKYELNKLSLFSNKNSFFVFIFVDDFPATVSIPKRNEKLCKNVTKWGA